MSHEFENLNVKNHLIDIFNVENKVQNIMKIIFTPFAACMLTGFFGFFFILTEPHISNLYLIPTILMGAIPMISVIHYENRVTKYLRKRYGRTYSQNILIEILKSVDNQKVMISYFNEMVKKYNNLTIRVNNVKTAFAKNDYDCVIEELPQLLNDIQYYEKKAQLEERNELERQEFEKKIGIESNNKNEEVEIEYNGQLKKYL